MGTSPAWAGPALIEIEPIPTDILIGDWASSAAPPPALTVSQWSDAHRVLPETSSAKGGPWRTDHAPYLRGIMDAVHEPGVTKIGLQKCAQVGGSEAIHNIIGYFVEHDPCPILMVHPTEGNAEEWSKDRLADMIRTTPALASAVRTKRQARDKHQGESTLTYKTFPNGFLAMGGANTENTFARRSVRIAIGDDVDRWPPVVGDEGDPYDLLAKRTEMWNDSLVIMVSTPNLKGGRINTMFERGDQRRYHVTCPGCGRVDYMTWSDPRHFHVAFEDRDPSTARLQCADQANGGCGLHIGEAIRRQMTRRGVWVPTAIAKDPGLATFHLPAMVTSLGKASLFHWVAEWLSSIERGKESTKAFINTTLADGWEDRGKRVESTDLVNRRTTYGDGVEAPPFVAVLTCGVDAQADRFEMHVIGWGPGGERATVDYRAIPGDPTKEETRSKLREALSRTYRHASGVELPIRSTFIDSGYATDDIYQFVRSQQHRDVYATKGGHNSWGTPLVKISEQKYGKHKRPVRLLLINVDDAKAELMGTLTVPAPGPGYWHFPLHLDTVHEGFFAGLCAEHRVTRYNKAKIATHEEWVQHYARNEPLDTAVLAFAAFRWLNPNVSQMQMAIASRAAAAAPSDVVVQAAAPGDVPPTTHLLTPAAPRTAKRRRSTRSNYLS